MHTADAILSIKLSQPEALFTSPDGLKKEYRDLARKWHPDTNPDPRAKDVFAHINALHDEAIRRIEAAAGWNRPGLLELQTVDLHKFQIRYRKQDTFELGEVFLSPTVVAWIVTRENRDLAIQALKLSEHFRYPSDKLKKEMARFLPTYRYIAQLVDGRTIFVVPKTEDVYRLKDVLLLAGKVPPTQVAWIVSGLLNIACYLGLQGIVHGDISTEATFVSLKHHSSLLLGGWYYATMENQKLLALPGRTTAALNKNLYADKKAHAAVNVNLIKALGRELLGDRSGAHLQWDKTLPAPMVEWLLLPSRRTALEEYAHWYNVVLPAAFGKRKFVQWDLDEQAIYTTGD